MVFTREIRYHNRSPYHESLASDYCPGVEIPERRYCYTPGDPTNGNLTLFPVAQSCKLAVSVALPMQEPKLRNTSR